MTSTQATGMPRDFGFGEDEALLRDMARKFLAESLPIERLRQLAAGDWEQTYTKGERPGWDEALWRQCIELGWTGLAVPEAQGGSGIKLVGIAALLEEVGRAALPAPLVPTIASSYVLRSAETDAARAWLERIAQGTSMALATTNAQGDWSTDATSISCRPSQGGGLVLEGHAFFVQDAFKADTFLALARGEDGLRLAVVDAGASGLALEQNHIHDLTRDQATLHFEGVEVEAKDVVSLSGDAALAAAWPAILVAVSADLVGSSEWQLQTTAEYAKTRKQFDRPIGFFQAVKHPLSNALLKIDRARSLVYHAACCVDASDAGALDAARMAKSAASDAGRFASDRSVQLHGGIGFTWESDVHLYFKRSLHNQALYGDGAYQRAKLADSLVGPIGAD